ncbi:uncharacterized protein RMCT_2328 [Mycolicibacterium thermoresistibile]|uniref:Uncharacterized protein n=1 Tax=Mycolicibacterium thermoresistibile TaxID=1797 RepID=A0A100XFD2_MYCTH|nr:uncharacterized protein RMCT_2328 [Mycolicibacterium thermoresistibile]
MLEASGGHPKSLLSILEADRDNLSSPPTASNNDTDRPGCSTARGAPDRAPREAVGAAAATLRKAARTRPTRA